MIKNAEAKKAIVTENEAFDNHYKGNVRKYAQENAKADPSFYRWLFDSEGNDFELPSPKSKAKIAFKEFLLSLQTEHETLDAIFEAQEEEFDYCTRSTDELAVICENKRAEHEIFIFFTPENAKQCGAKKTKVKMSLLWEKAYCYEGTDVVSYYVRAYKGGGLYATTNYEHNDFGIYQDKPSKRDF